MSEEAWKKSESIYKALIEHPFNQELMKGTLPKEKFGYYIEQDSIYLKGLARVFAKIAALSHNAENIKQFSKFALDSIIIGEEIVNKFIGDELELKVTGNVANATSNYVKYLIDLSINEPIEVIIAAILPAVWVYHEAGLYIAKNANSLNSFHLWIETYSGQEFAHCVKYVIEIFDRFSEQLGGAAKLKMLNVFHKSVCLEKEFLDDVYACTFKPELACKI
ncbi:TenA family protein [Wolbachia endosymbiont of Ctenocephalides felis wCfeT]|uniref:TenA family protein n=1 Tax=Wolbachia endosymbiont of Ctenocephalides felis wCfeT TaxID=2732593 RepID=UPI001C551726|nr:TenA family protein [Wolbachia endosymbiont of Ctenocephalides felis wCfeT]